MNLLWYNWFRKKLEQKVRAYKNWIYDNRNRPMREIIKELNVKLIGHYRYYGVTWNFRKITTFLHRVQQFLFKAMNRRGCRRAYTWNGFVEMLKYYPLAKPKTYYCLYWSECYYEEPYAGKPHVRICEGLRLRGLSLLDFETEKSLRKESKVVQTKKQYGDFSLTALSFASISIFSGWTKRVNSIWTFNYDTLFIIG